MEAEVGRMAKDTPTEPVPEAQGRLGRAVGFLRAHRTAIWDVTKTVGVIVGVVGTVLGIFVDFQETTQILESSEPTVAVADVSGVAPKKRVAPKEAECGNGVVEEGEACDDGGALGYALCRQDCQSNLARIQGGSLFQGYRQAELDEGMHLLMPSRRRPEDLLKAAKWATPATPVQYGKFWIMRTEVTWKALSAFLDHAGPAAKDVVLEDDMEKVKGFPSVRSEASIQWHLEAMARARDKFRLDGGMLRGRPEQPARADVETAIAYCAWLGGILPTEAQWEATARGPGGKRIFPWGERVPKSSPEDCDLLTGFFHLSMDPPLDFNCGGRNTTAPGSKPAGCTPDGICDLAGNVDEYVLPSATVWKEKPGPGGAMMAISTHPGPQLDASGQIQFLRVCADLGREDPYGLVSGWLSDCIVADPDAPENPWAKTTFPAEQAGLVLKGGNFDDSLPVLYQNRARFPWGDRKHNKGFRCVVQ